MPDYVGSTDVWVACNSGFPVRCKGCPGLRQQWHGDEAADEECRAERHHLVTYVGAHKPQNCDMEVL